MLSRIAESMFWIGRYVERAEDTARFLQTHLRMLIEDTTAAEVDQSKVVIRFGDQEVYPSPVDSEGLDALSEYMRGDEVRITAALAAGQSSATVWGCDLTDGYVRINADYTT